MIRVMLVDDEWMVRAMLRLVLEAADGISVVAEAGDGLAAVEQARRHRPDVALMDIRMPRLDGLAAIERLVALPHPPQVVVLTTFDLDTYVYRALRLGAVGFLLKANPAEELVAAVRSAAAGDAVLAPRVTRRLLDAFADHGATRAQARSQLAPLTGRERDVLACVAAGLSNAEVGVRLHMSEATVKTHVSRVLAKLGLANRVQAAILAHDAGLSLSLTDQPEQPQRRGRGGAPAP